MVSPDDIQIEITPEVLLKAYACGIFPMAERADDPVLYWIEPKERGVLPLDGFRVPRSLARAVRRADYEVRIDHDFDAVVAACAEPAPGRRQTWINSQIRRLYRQLFEKGHAHTVEIWRDGELAGGLYGVHLGAAFFGESMFTRRRDMSKVALVHLVGRLKYGGFSLLDTQFVTEHLKRFGAIEISRPDYHRRLDAAMRASADFYRLPTSTSSDSILQLVSHTS